MAQIDKAVATAKLGLQDRNLRLATDWLPLDILLFEILGDQKRWDEYEAAMTNGVAYRVGFFSVDHPMTLEFKAQLAHWLCDQDRVEEAKDYIQPCKRLAEHERATDQRKEIAMRTLITIYDSLGETSQSEAWQAQLDELLAARSTAK